MSCRHFETRLEALLDRELPAAERTACLLHAEDCPACRELLELAAVAAPPEDLVAAVLASTSGPACERALEQLAGFQDLAATRTSDRQLVALHLAGCEDCRALAGVLAALAADLPGMAEVRPDERLVADVLAATLPVTVRVRRWWERTRFQTWPRWVRRPRFALEAAFVLTVACLPLVMTSASALAALPGRAVEMAQQGPGAELDRLLLERLPGGESDPPWEERLEGTVREIRESPVARRTEQSFGSVRETLRGLGGAVAAGAGEAASLARQGYGTLRDFAASLLSNAGEDRTSPEANDTAPARSGPAFEETR